MNNNVKKILITVFASIVLLLETLPYGVVLNFANPEGEPWRRTFSYFSLTPFGYANFGPFITALLSCIIIVFVIVSWFINTNIINSSIKLLSGIAIITSLMPLINGIDYITLIGILISLFISIILILCLLKENK